MAASENFKVDDSNRSDYELAGAGPFKPFEDKPMLMPYYEVPAEILEDRTSLAGWALKALRVSASAPAKSWQKIDQADPDDEPLTDEELRQLNSDAGYVTGEEGKREFGLQVDLP